MCGFGQQKFDSSRFMKMDFFTSIIDILGTYTSTVRLNGRGESTIHPQFCDMLEYTRSRMPGNRITLFTNLSFNNPRTLQALLDNRVQLYLSVDSPYRDELETIRRGCRHEMVMNNIEQLQTLTNRPYIIFTLQEANLTRVLDIGRFAIHNEMHIIYNVVRRDTGMENFIAMVRDNIDSLTDDFSMIQELYSGTELSCLIPDSIAGIPLNSDGTTQTFGRKYICPALDSELCILYNGDVTPCNMFNPYVFGNLHNNTIDEILAGKARQDFVRAHKEFYYCKNCACLGDAT